MTLSDSPVALFLRGYERVSESNDIPAMVAQFGETFLAAGPLGACCVRSSDFALALPKRKQLFQSLGHSSTALISVDETPLDARYVLARTQWRFTFGKNGKRLEVVVDSTFLIDTGGDEFKIVVYLTNRDAVQILHERGIGGDGQQGICAGTAIEGSA
jgi:hypothetical protein